MRRVWPRLQGDQGLNEAQEEASHGRVPRLQVPLSDRQMRKEVPEGGRAQEAHAAARRSSAFQM